MDKKPNLFEKTLERSRKFCEKIIPSGPKKKIVFISISFFILYSTAWIIPTLYLMKFGPILTLSTVIIMAICSLFTLTPFLSVALEKVSFINSQSEEYRRKPENKNKLYVNFGSEGWKEFSFTYPNTTKSFREMVERNGFETEMGGEDDNQKKTRLRNNKIKDILGGQD